MRVVVVGLTLYRVIDAWGNLDFPFTKFEWLQAIGVSIWSAVTSLNWNLVQVLLYVSGIAWILLTSSPYRAEPLQLTLPEPKEKLRRRDPAQLKNAVLQLLLRAIKHGEVLVHSDTVSLAAKWDQKNVAMIRAAWGDDEVKRYLNEDGYRVYSIQDMLAVRIEKLKDIGRRVEFDDPPIHQDFVPEQWGYDS